LNLALIQEDEYENSIKTYKLSELNYFQFRNFCVEQKKNENFFYLLIAKALIYVKQKYIQNFKPEMKEYNLTIIEELIRTSFHEVIHKALKFQDREMWRFLDSLC
jgi:hypothetical protein